MYFLSIYVYKMYVYKISLEKAVSDGDIDAVTKLLDTENITQDRITNLKKSIEEKKKDPYTNVFILLNVSAPAPAPNTHSNYMAIDKLLDNYNAVEIVDKSANPTLNRDVQNTIRRFLGGKKTRKSRKNKSKKTKSKKSKKSKRKLRK
mgnify:FL=1